MIDIFINYRTSDEPLAAMVIDQALTARLGVDRVFLDHRAIEVGTEFPPEIWSAIQECRVLVAVIGSHWLAPDDQRHRRIDDPEDYVRRELAEVLRRNVKVVPVLVGDATLPAQADLPPEVAGLPLRQFRTMRFRGAQQDVDHIADELARLVGVVPAPVPATSTSTASPPAPTVTNNFNHRVNADNAVFGVAIDHR